MSGTGEHSGPHLIAIGGVYRRGDATVRLTGLSVLPGGPNVAVVTEAGWRSAYCKTSELTGPISLPCPLCGEQQFVTHPAVGIDLSEHIDRCKLWLDAKNAQGKVS